MTLPVKVSTVNANIGVIGMGTVQGYKAYIGALSVSSNGYDIVASGFIIAAKLYSRFNVYTSINYIIV